MRRTTTYRMRRTTIFAYVFVSVLAAFWLFPFAVSLVTVTKSANQFVNMSLWSFPRISDIPGNIIQNSITALIQGQLLEGIFNSIIYASVASVTAALITSLAGFALVHLDIKNSQAAFFILFCGNLLPFQMFMLPLYLGSSALGLYDTRLGLSLVYIGVSVPFALLVQRNYATNVPRELIEAARIDGCSNFKIFWNIFIPITKPAFFAVIVLDFTWVWNNLIFGMILTEDVRPIMAAVSKLEPSVRGYTAPPVVLTGSFIASIPAILVFVLLHRYFIEGFTVGVEK